MMVDSRAGMAGFPEGEGRRADRCTATMNQWISEVLHFCQGLPLILVGCKKDLRFDQKTIEELHKISQKPVTPEQVCGPDLQGDGGMTGQLFTDAVAFLGRQGEEVRKKIDAKVYLECSAKTNEGVREVFEQATRSALLGTKKTHRKKCLLL